MKSAETPSAPGSRRGWRLRDTSPPVHGPWCLVWSVLRRARATGLAPLVLSSRRRRFHGCVRLLAALAQNDCNRGRDEDRRIGPADDPDEHREGKAAKRFTAEQEQRHHRQERG